MKNYLKIIILTVLSYQCNSVFADTVAYTAGGGVAPQANTVTGVTNVPAASSAQVKPQLSIGDSDISADAQKKISDDPILSGSNITVITNGGVITLDGTVLNQAQANEAIRLMNTVNSVKGVNSKLTIANAASPVNASPTTSAATAAPAQGSNTQLTNVTEKHVIITTAPAPKETIMTPQGYINCFLVAAGWYQNVWVTQHRVCQYENASNGIAWIEGYWMCTKYDITQGQCTNWEWKSARWENTLKVY